jgi:hypothetical protein
MWKPVTAVLDHILDLQPLWYVYCHVCIWVVWIGNGILQNKVLRTIGNLPRRAPVRELYKAFNSPYIYNYITKLCRQQARVIENHKNENVRKAKPDTKNIRGLNLAAAKRTTVQVSRLSL